MQAHVAYGVRCRRCGLFVGLGALRYSWCMERGLLQLRYRLGAGASRLTHAALSSPHFPLTRYLPRGIFWLYDLQRFLGTRNLGVLFDVGANAGQTLNKLLQYAPGSEIHCFEPADVPFRTLAIRYGDRKNVHLHQQALGSRLEMRPLLTREDFELNTFVGATEGTGATTVSVATVDSVVAERGISHLDLLKLDVQGWETEVLRGAESLIASDNVVSIFVEVAFREDSEMQQFSELHSVLTGKGFALSGLYDPLRYGPRKEFVLFANALYLHPQARLKWKPGLRAEWDAWMGQQRV